MRFYTVLLLGLCGCNPASAVEYTSGTVSASFRSDDEQGGFHVVDLEADESEAWSLFATPDPMLIHATWWGVPMSFPGLVPAFEDDQSNADVSVAINPSSGEVFARLDIRAQYVDDSAVQYNVDSCELFVDGTFPPVEPGLSGETAPTRVPNADAGDPCPTLESASLPVTMRFRWQFDEHVANPVRNDSR